ncbi:MAG: hypothetical protein ABEK01_03670 [Candidatus Nanohaloarchaea archaeon]
MGAVDQVVMFMYEEGMNLLLSWLLVFAVTYGVLDKYQAISEDSQINGVIALAVSFMFLFGIWRFAPEGMWTHFAANIAFAVFGVVGLLILSGVAGIDLEEYVQNSGGLMKVVIGIIAVVSFVSVLIGYGGGTQITDGPVFEEVVMPILILVFIITVVYLAGE